ncbi:hypothetical protein NMY22_g17037 [Coprinellus aureogranulatus]|nr:hypothetical protein NMY22_g17037 [Coprinellus aureogranulatus]
MPARKAVNRPELIMSRSSLLRLSTNYGAYQKLTIDASLLFDDLVHPNSADALHIVLADIRSLTIDRMVESSWRLTDVVLNELFRLLLSLRKLKHLAIKDFVLPYPNHPPTIPSCLSDKQLTVDTLGITNTHQSSLSFLFRCIEPRRLTLDSCCFITELPYCEELNLLRIPSFAGFSAVLSRWNGLHLKIERSPFLNEAFIRELRTLMHTTKEAICPDAEITWKGYPYEIRSVIFLAVCSHPSVLHQWYERLTGMCTHYENIEAKPLQAIYEPLHIAPDIAALQGNAWRLAILQSLYDSLYDFPLLQWIRCLPALAQDAYFRLGKGTGMEVRLPTEIVSPPTTFRLIRLSSKSG